MRRNYKMFILDGDSGNLERINELLKNDNVEIEGFLSQEKLIERLKVFYPDFIVISFCDEVESRSKLLSKLRKHNIFSKVPFIVYLPKMTNAISTKFGSDKMISFVDFPFQVSQFKTCFKKSEHRDHELVAELSGIGKGDASINIAFTQANKSVIKGRSYVKVKSGTGYKVKLEKSDQYLFFSNKMEPSDRIVFNKNTGIFDIEFFLKGVSHQFLKELDKKE